MSSYKNEPINYISGFSDGLTKLEYFAGEAMKGLLSSGDRDVNVVSVNAILQAKALLAELEKEREG